MDGRMAGTGQRIMPDLRAVSGVLPARCHCEPQVDPRAAGSGDPDVAGSANRGSESARVGVLLSASRHGVNSGPSILAEGCRSMRRDASALLVAGPAGAGRRGRADISVSGRLCASSGGAMGRHHAFLPSSPGPAGALRGSDSGGRGFAPISARRHRADRGRGVVPSSGARPGFPAPGGGMSLHRAIPDGSLLPPRSGLYRP